MLCAGWSCAAFEVLAFLLVLTGAAPAAVLVAAVSALIRFVGLHKSFPQRGRGAFAASVALVLGERTHPYTPLAWILFFAFFVSSVAVVLWGLSLGRPRRLTRYPLRIASIFLLLVSIAVRTGSPQPPPPAQLLRPRPPNVLLPFHHSHWMIELSPLYHWNDDDFLAVVFVCRTVPVGLQCCMAGRRRPPARRQGATEAGPGSANDIATSSINPGGRSGGSRCIIWRCGRSCCGMC